MSQLQSSVRSFKKNILRLTSRLAAVLMSVLGFSSCSVEGIDGDDEVICMYGMPYAIYEVKGAVTDADNNPVEGAEVVVKAVYNESDSFVIGDPVATDASGNYDFKEGYSMINKVRVVVADANLRMCDSTEVTLSRINGQPSSESDVWNRGTYGAIADVVLKSPIDKK